ncbi:MAG: phosphodiester glycosidase family protein [Dokdonella sp.]|uniref:phosphodiester glycosidase family protein n=1 Tax=Dokdonella sp. TaxID=2291710 RepID=UPI003F7E7BC2
MRVILVPLVLALAGAAPLAAAPALRTVRAGDVDCRVVEIDLATDRLELHWKDDDGRPFGAVDRLREWGQGHGRTLLFAANAGIYDSQYRPLGLHIEDGHTVRPLNTARTGVGRGNFALPPNGVFYVDRLDRAGVVTTARWQKSRIAARLATQSGPMLVIDGELNPNFDAASDSLKWRSGVCAPEPGRVLFAVSEAPLSFHAFAAMFRDELGCRDALYLDGTLSRFWTPVGGYAGAAAVLVRPYAGMFAVFADGEPSASSKAD